MTLAAIAIVDSRGGIAKNGKQPIFIKEDLKRFRELTTGHPVVYGRKTYEQMGLLPNRLNYILSRTLTETPELAKEAEEKGASVHVCTSLPSMMKLLDGHDDYVYVIGGADIYRQFLPHCDFVYLTRVLEDLKCDQFFPPMNIFDWRRLRSSEVLLDSDTKLLYNFEAYIRTDE